MVKNIYQDELLIGYVIQEGYQFKISPIFLHNSSFLVSNKTLVEDDYHLEYSSFNESKVSLQKLFDKYVDLLSETAFKEPQEVILKSTFQNIEINTDINGKYKLPSSDILTEFVSDTVALTDANVWLHDFEIGQVQFRRKLNLYESSNFVYEFYVPSSFYKLNQHKFPMVEEVNEFHSKNCKSITELAQTLIVRFQNFVQKITKGM